MEDEAAANKHDEGRKRVYRNLVLCHVKIYGRALVIEADSSAQADSAAAATTTAEAAAAASGAQHRALLAAYRAVGAGIM